jgi:Domain of unknown function (DUF1772)
MTPCNEIVQLGGADPLSARAVAWRVVRTAAIASAAAFAGGGLLTQTVIVPSWRAMEPAAFLTTFATYGPAMGATLFPIELLAVILLALVVYSTMRIGGPGRLVWGGALLCMIATILLVPLYFAGANNGFLSRTIAENAVAHELRSWYAWNWVRTGLAFLAVVLGSVGFMYRSNNHY